MTARTWVAERMLQLLNSHQAVTLSFLSEQVDRSKDKTLSSLNILVHRGLVELIGIDQYHLTDAGRIAAGSGSRVRTGGADQSRKVRIERKSLRVRAWKALRIEGGKSTIANLLTLLSTDDEGAADTNLLKYFTALHHAGILSRLRRRAKGRAPSSNGFVVWAIIRDLGPKAPIWQPTKNQVFDPNTNTIHPLSPPAPEELRHDLRYCC